MDNKAVITELLKDFYPFAQKQLGFNKPVRVFLTKDIQNSRDPLGKTAFYDPQEMHLKLFYVNRHPKDVLRSFAHELMHHKQNCDGRLNSDVGEGPVDQNENLAKLEEEANKAGFLVRQWEEQCPEYKKRLYKGIQILNKAEGESDNLVKLQEKKKKKKKLKIKPNPWAICTASVGRKDKKDYESCVLNVKDQYGIKKENLQESKMSKNTDFERSLDDTTESDTIKDHYSKRAERVFEKLTDKWKTKKESEVKSND